jgi:hypothetical protein
MGNGNIAFLDYTVAKDLIELTDHLFCFCYENDP